MIHKINKEDIDVDKVIQLLDNKTNMFDYKDKEQYKKDIKDGKYLLIGEEQLVCIGEIIQYNTGIKALSLTIVNLSDNKDKLKYSIDQIEDIARSIGIDRIILEGRYGWVKVFPSYKLSSVTLIKEL